MSPVEVEVKLTVRGETPESLSQVKLATGGSFLHELKTTAANNSNAVNRHKLIPTLYSAKKPTDAFLMV